MANFISARTDADAQSIARFAEYMLEKLDAHSDRGRGSWAGVPKEKLFVWLLSEVHELGAEVFEQVGPSPHSGYPRRTVLEAADVANIAMMIADITLEKIR